MNIMIIPGTQNETLDEIAAYIRFTWKTHTSGCALWYSKCFSVEYQPMNIGRNETVPGEHQTTISIITRRLFVMING